jgi:methionine salvage enolase-phosphatase E1
MKINFDDLNVEKLSELMNELIDNKKTFEITGLRNERFDDAVKFVENIIESKGLRCRVYTSGRVAATGATFVGGITGALGVASIVGIAAHNLVTRNPDYEIAKHRIQKKLTVKYCKIS